MRKPALLLAAVLLPAASRAVELEGGVKGVPQAVVAPVNAPVKTPELNALTQTPAVVSPAASPATIATPELAILPQPLPVLAPSAALEQPSLKTDAPSANETLTQAVAQELPGTVLFDHAKAYIGDASAVPGEDQSDARFADVMVGVFDADDNLWLNANGVWVFKKGSNHAEKVRIPSEEFAHVRQSVGKSGKYADYEYWGDQREGSFWEFYSQPGRNVLLENLKRMVAERKPEEWQGKSWPAFRAMLKANAKGVHILTASGVSQKEFIEALRFLASQGFLDAVPPESNVQAVGNPAHPFYASTSSPSKAKLLTMKHLVLDPLQRRAERLKAQGKRPPLLLGPDGRTLEHLMPVGFSDDDPGNISAMKDGADGEPGLAADYAAGRWPDLKISLFDSDPEDPKAVNTVIRRDGALRPRTAQDDASERP